MTTHEPPSELLTLTLQRRPKEAAFSLEPSELRKSEATLGWLSILGSLLGSLI